MDPNASFEFTSEVDLQKSKIPGKVGGELQQFLMFGTAADYGDEYYDEEWDEDPKAVKGKPKQKAIKSSGMKAIAAPAKPKSTAKKPTAKKKK